MVALHPLCGLRPTKREKESPPRARLAAPARGTCHVTCHVCALSASRHRPAEVEKGVEEHQHSAVLQAQEVGLFAQRYRVGRQPRTPRPARQKERGTQVAGR
jgi:hypothetical protein